MFFLPKKVFYEGASERASGACAGIHMLAASRANRLTINELIWGNKKIPPSSSNMIHDDRLASQPEPQLQTKSLRNIGQKMFLANNPGGRLVFN